MIKVLGGMAGCKDRPGGYCALRLVLATTFFRGGIIWRRRLEADRLDSLPNMRVGFLKGRGQGLMNLPWLRHLTRGHTPYVHIYNLSDV